MPNSSINVEPSPTVERVACICCGIYHPRETAKDRGWHTHGSKWYCPACHQHHYRKCGGCGKWIRASGAETSVMNSRGARVVLCVSCRAGEKWQRCRWCGKYALVGGSHEEHGAFYTDGSRFGDQVLTCYGCYGAHFRACLVCGTYHDVSTMTGIGGGSYVCDTCMDAGEYSHCSYCDRVYCTDSLHPYGGELYCSDCISRMYLHDYGYKPRPLFHNRKCENKQKNLKLYLGVELEVDIARGIRVDIDRQGLAKELSGFSDEGVLFYCKTDGSLTGGLEIVTHPCTLEYHLKDMPWEGILDTVIDAGYRSHDTTTCGLHVHVNKNWFSEISQLKVGYFVYSNNPYLSILGRRSYSDYAKMKSVGNRARDVRHVKDPRDRYYAVNFTPDKTVEFRFIKGTLNIHTLRASLQLVSAICHFCTTTSTTILLKKASGWSRFCDFVKEDTSKFKELIQYMKDKNLLDNNRD